LSRQNRFRLAILMTLCVTVLLIAAWTTSAQSVQNPSVQDPAKVTDDLSLLDGFRHVEVASVSDAIEQILGRRMYMTHQMRPIFPAKFAGYALTVQLKKEEGTKDPQALTGMLAAIDHGPPHSV